MWIKTLADWNNLYAFRPYTPNIAWTAHALTWILWQFENLSLLSETFYGYATLHKHYIQYHVNRNVVTILVSTFTHKFIVSCEEPTTNPSVNLQLNSTLVGSRLLLWCGEGDNVTIYTSWCSENTTWLPDPAQLVCPLSSLPPSNTMSFPTLTGTVIHALCLQLWVNKGKLWHTNGSYHLNSSSNNLKHNILWGFSPSKVSRYMVYNISYIFISMILYM